MILVKETTKWESKTPNHHYLLSSNKGTIYGYIPRGSKELKLFKKPTNFDKRYRTFKTIKKDLTFVG